LSVGKNLALLQAEASACGLELANVPNVRWQSFFLAGRQNKNSIKLAPRFIFTALHLTSVYRYCVYMYYMINDKNSTQNGFIPHYVKDIHF
jgi:hypothetical protein